MNGSSRTNLIRDLPDLLQTFDLEKLLLRLIFHGLPSFQNLLQSGN